VRRPVAADNVGGLGYNRGSIGAAQAPDCRIGLSRGFF